MFKVGNTAMNVNTGEIGTVYYVKRKSLRVFTNDGNSKRKWDFSDLAHPIGTFVKFHHNGELAEVTGYTNVDGKPAYTVNPEGDSCNNPLLSEVY